MDASERGGGGGGGMWTPRLRSRARAAATSWRACCLVGELDDGHPRCQDTLHVAVQAQAVAVQQPPRRLRQDAAVLLSQLLVRRSSHWEAKRSKVQGSHSSSKHIIGHSSSTSSPSPVPSVALRASYCLPGEPALPPYSPCVTKDRCARHAWRMSLSSAASSAVQRV